MSREDSDGGIYGRQREGSSGRNYSLGALGPEVLKVPEGENYA